jgi:ATP-dependent RNA helicase DDX59
VNTSSLNHRTLNSRECKAIDMQRTQAEKQRLTSAPDTNTTIAPAPRHAPVYYPIERFHAHLTVYQPHPDVARLNMVELEALRMMHQIKVRGRHVPPPLTDFSQIPMPNRLYERLTTLYSNTPTPVQMQVIPAALTARDLIVAAPTGSGKTLAFLLPCIIHACALSNAFGTRGQPYVLVVGPTHDLCAQLQAKAQALCQGLPNMRTALLTGKTPLPPQLYRLEHGAALAFGTPGRLLRILNTLPQTDWPRWDIIILDEVDHLVYSKTSEEDIKLLLSKLISVEKDVHDQRLASAKQLMVFSATRAWRTRRLFKTWMNDVIRIAIGDLDIIAPDVRQTFYWVENQSKKRQLFRLLDAPDRYPTFRRKVAC